MLFPHGQVVATPRVLEEIPDAEIQKGLQRHFSGDWGDVPAGDAELNNAALKHGSRLLSAYQVDADRTFWIITEADRSSTTVLLPSEY